MSPSNGGAGGSRSTPPAWRSLLPAPGSWAPDIPTTCSRTAPEGQRKEAKVTRTAPRSAPTYGRIRQGFVYERVPHITLKSIANNAEIDVIWEKFQETLEPLRSDLNAALGRSWEEWEVPREAGDPWPEPAAVAWGKLQAAKTSDKKAAALLTLNRELGRSYTLDDVPDEPRDPWNSDATELHQRWWEARIARQREIDASIAAKADFEYLYDRPCEDRKVVRTAGPFTVESLSPHRTLGVDENDEVMNRAAEPKGHYGREPEFVPMILENLRTTGVQQAHKEDKLAFTSVIPWPGRFVCAEGRYVEGASKDDDESIGPEKRAAIFVGPEFGTVSRPDLVAATREAAEARFDVLVACAFSYDAHSSEFDRLGHVPVLKARMNADLHMADDLKNTGKGNLFVIFGEPDIEILDADTGQIRVRINGVDVFHPNTGEVRSGRPGRDRLLVRRHRLQRGELLRPPRLLPRRQRPLQVLEDHPPRRDRPRGLGDPPQRHLPPLPQARLRAHRGQGDQPPRRRSHEGLPRMS